MIVKNTQIKYEQKKLVNSLIFDAPNWRISAFEKRFRETERSINVVDSVKMSGGGFISLIVVEIFVESHVQFKEITPMNFTYFTIF